jgi:methyl-galactoside transport system substrate-binding protein
MLKRWTAVLTAAVMICLSGCSGQQEETVKSIKIGVTLYDQYDTFISELMDTFTTYASKKEDESGIAINLEILDASGSQSSQNEQVQMLIEKGCDVICVNLVDRTEPTTITDLAEKNEIPIIFFNRELVAEDLERWDQLYYVGADAFQSGEMEGELAAEAFLEDSSKDKNGDGICQYVVLEGEAGHQDSIVRTEYSINTLMEQGVEAEKLGYAIANWNRSQAQTKMVSMFSQFGDQIELVMANNDDMALGAIDALKAEGIARDQWPIIVGIDGTDVGLDAVEKGEMAGTVYNDKEGQAREMLNLAFAIATGSGLEDIELEDGKYIRLPYSKVTK